MCACECGLVKIKCDISFPEVVVDRVHGKISIIDKSSSKIYVDTFCGNLG